MTRLFHAFATPFITGLFIVSLISGIALFFHIGPGGFHAMHEWLSLVLILPFGLHLWKNWRPMIGYFRRAPMLIALVISAIASGLFLLPTDGEESAGRPPQFLLVHRILSHSVEDVAPGLGLSAEALAGKLAAAGFAVENVTQSLTDIAAASGKSEADLAASLIAGGT